MSDININSQADKVTDPKLLKLITRVAREMELSIEKVAANHAQPTAFPLPDRPNSTEQILAARFKALPQEFKTKAGVAAMSRINAPAAARKEQLGDLAAVNLKTSVSVGEQVRAMPLPAALKFTAADLTKMTGASVAVAGAAGVNVALAGAPGVSSILPGTIGAAILPKLTKLELRLHKVECVEETRELGKDEFILGGLVVSVAGKTRPVPSFSVGSFHSGGKVNFTPPRSFATFDLNEGTASPKVVHAVLAAAEDDPGGGLPKFINDLVQKVKEKVSAALVGAAVGLAGGPLGIIIGAAVGFVIGKVFSFLKDIFRDDLFRPAMLSVRIASLTARWPGGKTDSPEGVATFKGHGGEYRVTYDWRMRA